MSYPTTQPTDVLVVDDNLPSLHLLSALLSERNYHVRPASSGGLALEAARGTRPDLILLDTQMPGMNGYQVCEQLRQDETLARIPVIFVSGAGETVDKIRAFDAGAVDYITKPYEIDEIDARIQTHLKLRGLRRALREEKRQLQEVLAKLQREEELRDQLTHMLASDLRNPLGVVMMTLGLARQNCSEIGNDCVASFLDEGMNQAELMAGMIDELIDIRRFEDGQMPLRLASADLREVAIDGLRTVTRNPGRCVFEDPGAPCLGRFDRGLVRRVVVNLLANATKFSPKDGEIRVRIQHDAESLRLTVRDFGPGIPKEHKQNIFLKFWQIRSKKRDATPSSGLGLAFCRLAIEAHGGVIGVESDEGRGSEFWFVIPREAEPTKESDFSS